MGSSTQTQSKPTQRSMSHLHQTDDRKVNLGDVMDQSVSRIGGSYRMPLATVIYNQPDKKGIKEIVNKVNNFQNN